MGAFLESVFRFLFKYRPLVFEKGRLAFATPWPLALVLVIGAVAAAVAVIAYVRLRGHKRTDVVALAGLRVAALALLLFALIRPTLLVPTVVPQRNFVGVLVDDSRSMRIDDLDGMSRGAYVGRWFGSPDSALHSALAERFMLRFFRFSSRAERLERTDQLGFDGTGTDLAGALDRARRELAAVPLAGLILVSDGADNSGSSLTESLLALKADRVPVYTVGLGRDRFDRDIELSRVETPRTVLRGSSLVVDLAVRQTGYPGRTVRVDVEDAGRIVTSRDVELPGDGEPASVRLHFKASQPGPRTFRFRIARQPGERVTQNNVREALIVVEDRREKILYFEGEPRFEVKFLRRAVAEDDIVQVVVLQRTAENKFLRLDVDDAEELAGGFPRTREELFRYRGLILGSVEASFFTHDQLRMIQEFVGQRGGGLLALGGRSAFGRGGYQGTPVADVLPVLLEERGDADFLAELRVEPTRFGRTHPVTRLTEAGEGAVLPWAELPPLTSVNPLHRVKPGASTLLVGEGEGLRERAVVLAYQRYGRGKSVALPVQDSWMWQMHADVPLEDLTHETFWRQLLRWLVSYVPDPVVATTSADRTPPGEPVTIAAEVQDETYLRVNNARVTARVTTPSGAARELPLEWRVQEDGRYRARFVPEERGLHRVEIDAGKDGDPLGAAVTYFHVAPLDDEFFGAEMRAPLLERIAEETGGRFYTQADVTTLPEDVSFTESGATVLEERELWDMPAILLALILLLAGEWFYRRRRGLA